MEFCDKCGSMFVKKDGKYVCTRCGNVKDSIKINTSEKFAEKKKVEAVKESEEIHAITPASCPKCNHDKAYTWSKQMRGSDEPETIFFKCVKCGWSWRKSRG